MPRLPALLASIAVLLVLPLMALRAQDGGALPLGFDAIAPNELRVLERARQPAAQGQVRIEGRLVVRIAPSSEATRARILSELPRRPLRTAWQEADHGDCVAVADLVGVQPLADNRLLLFTRERAVLAATLEPSSSAEAFYSGFYVEHNADGRLCVSRDRLQSRTGSSCAVAGFSRLVALRD